ncbi:MAG TPA: M48 family peptidase [Terriglobia bacterium]|nr:M48 family peptidase [Terriglobia bacterium]
MRLTSQPSDPEQLALFPVAPSRIPQDGAADLNGIFERVFHRLTLRRPAPAFQAAFRPFAGLRSSIHLRNQIARVKVSDVLAPAPPLVLEALAEILLAPLFRRRASREARECYMAYVFKPAVRRRIEAARRRRGYKRLLPPQGKRFNLDKIFADLNDRLFAGRISVLKLGWTPRRSRTVLGHYDSAHRTISISRWLDSPGLPKYLVEYVIYHEMLHAKFPVGRQGHRRVVHSAAFRAAEKKFPQYAEARRRLKQSCD